MPHFFVDMAKKEDKDIMNTDLTDIADSGVVAGVEDKDNSETDGKHSSEKKKKRSLASKIAWTFIWILLTPIILFLILAVVIYIPPVQKFAVDKAAEYLSEQMDMDVSVEKVLLRFPLDLSIGGVVAVQEGDTLLDAKSLVLNVRMQPLFEKKVEVDGVELDDVSVYTKNLIEACVIKGHVGRFRLTSHSTDLAEEVAVVSLASLSDANISLILADSVPEDTSVSEPVAWKVKLENVALENVALDLGLSPQADSVFAGVSIGDALLKGNLDLNSETYSVENLKVNNSALCYDICKGEVGERRTIFSMVDEMKKMGSVEVKDFDPNHIFLYDVALRLDSTEYKGTGDLHTAIKSFVAKERCGLEVVKANGGFVMDSVSLGVPEFFLNTANSSFQLSATMDLNAFDDSIPGTFGMKAKGSVGKGDILLFAAEYREMMNEGLPDKSFDITADIDGNLRSLRLNDLSVAVDGAFDAKAGGLVTNVMDSLLIGGKMTLDANLTDLGFVKGFVPKETANSFMIPRGMKLNVQGDMYDRKVSVDAGLHSGDCVVMLNADYSLYNDSYTADLDISDFVLNDFVPVTDTLRLTGSMTAEGRGLDVYSPRTWAKVGLLLDEAKMGTIDVSNTKALIGLENNQLSLDMNCNNDLLRTTFMLKSLLKENEINANLDIDLPYVDIKGLGFSPERLEVTTKGQFTFVSDMGDNFSLDSHVDGLGMMIGTDSINTEDLDIHAKIDATNTEAIINSGDLSFNFNSPNNLFRFIEKIVEMADFADKQLRNRDMDLDKLKAYMPLATLKATVGEENPLSRIMAVKGITFEDMEADFKMAPEYGVVGGAHVYGLTNDTVMIDTVFLRLWQDSTKLAFRSGVICKDQKLCPAFSAFVGGYADFDEADVRLLFMNKKKEKGVDFGVRANMMDSTIHVSLYPEVPIIAFRKFELNKDNYIDLYRNGKIMADIDLKSMEDSCSICLSSNPEEGYLQDARAIINNLNLADLMKVLPFMPSMSGLLNVDARYVQTTENFTVGSDMEVKKFSYEGMPVGDLRSVLHYEPSGQYTHDVSGTLSYNGSEVADIAGSYNAEGEGAMNAILSLKSLPLAIASPFIPEQMVRFGGFASGELSVAGPMDKLLFNGVIMPDSVTMKSDMYALDMRFANDSIEIKDSRLTFNRYSIYGAGENPLTLNGYVDFSNMDEMQLGLGLYGRDFQLINSKRTPKSVVFGKMYGDFFARLTGTTNDLSIRGMVKVLSNTDMTYIMDDTPLSVDYRLDDIVTFTDFTAPPDTTELNKEHVFTGMDMSVQLVVEDGARFHCEFSADRQSYIDVQGGGTLIMDYTPEGVLTLQGRYTLNEGEMKYTLPVIPLKTFTLKSGSYIDFTGEPMNPTLNIEATERTKASVSDDDGNNRSVNFDVGLKITNTLENMGLEFTIDAPEDMTIQNELAGYSTEEKNKLAVALLATGMYLSSTNSSGFSAGNALNSFLQNEINNIAGQALSTAVDVSVGMDQNTQDDGSTRTDYSFKFSKRFFSNRLSVVIGGKVSSDDGNGTSSGGTGTYIDDVSLEWRLDDGGTRYVRIFHEKNYDNLLEGELVENGAGIVLRKKMNNLSELFVFNSKKKQQEELERMRQRNSNKENNEQKNSVESQNKEREDNESESDSGNAVQETNDNAQ